MSAAPRPKTKQRNHPPSNSPPTRRPSPRSNAAFAAEYNALLPNTWAVVNDQDPIARIPKGAFRRSGRRVVLNALGDAAVRPGPLEARLLERTRVGEPAHHKVGGYRASLAALVKSQFGGARALVGGEAGAAALAEAVDLNAALMMRNADLASLRDPGKQPVLLEELAKAPRRRARRAPSAHPAPRAWCGCGGGGAPPCAAAAGAAEYGSDGEERV